MLHLVPKFLRRHPEAVKTVFLPAPLAHPLDVRERLEIRDWLGLDTTKKVLSLMEARHPGTRTAGISKLARSEWDERAAVNFLNRISGWEKYRNDLITLCEAPPAPAVGIEEQYPSQ